MKKIQKYLISNFTIFSMLVFLQAVMHKLGIVDVFNSGIVIQYFVMSGVLSATVIVINFNLYRRPAVVRLLITIAAAFAEVVLLGGMLMQWYVLRTKWVLISLALCIVITVILYYVTGIFEIKNTAKQINRAIIMKRNKAGDIDTNNLQ